MLLIVTVVINNCFVSNKDLEAGVLCDVDVCSTKAFSHGGLGPPGHIT